MKRSSIFQLSVLKSLFQIWAVNPPDLHCYWLDADRLSVLSPCVPVKVRLSIGILVQWWAVEVCLATLIKPPACVVVLHAAALHSFAIKSAERNAAIIIDIWGTERCRVLILLLLISSESITCQGRNLPFKKKVLWSKLGVWWKII